MFELKITQKKVTNPTGDRIFLKDVTGSIGDITYTLGADGVTYTPVTNNTGYGPPNPWRGDLALIIIGKLKTNAADVPVEFVPYDPLTVTEFAAKVKEDGWYQFYMVSLPKTGATRYDVATSTIYLNGVVVTADALLNQGLTTAFTEQLFLANNSLKKNALNNRIVDLHIDNHNCCNDAEIKRLQRIYNQLRGIMEGAVYEYCRGNKFNAQKNVSFINTHIADV